MAVWVVPDMETGMNYCLTYSEQDATAQLLLTSRLGYLLTLFV